MLQTLNCIRMGEVLFDENLQLFILCNNCHTDLRSLQDFRQHLEKCEGMENLFQEGRQHFKYNTDKCTQLFGKTIKGIKEFLIYDHTDVEVVCNKTEENFIDLINIEEELLDPKWYSDLNVDVSKSSPQKTSKQYEELVEAVTPFVQFKENLKSNNNGSNNIPKSNLVRSSAELKINTIPTDKIVKNVKFDLTSNKARPTAKRKLAMPKTLPIQFAIPAIPAEINTSASNTLLNTTPISKLPKEFANKKRKSEPIINGFVKKKDIFPIITTAPKNTTTLPPTNKTHNMALNSASQKTTTMPKQEPTREKQTAQILNKLQNLGLQVKRTQPLPQPVPANSSSTNKTDTKTLEILQRLQSKGMKVKILNKQQTTERNVNMPMATPQQGFITNSTQKPISVVCNSAVNMAIKQNLNKNLIIKKVN